MVISFSLQTISINLFLVLSVCAPLFHSVSLLEKAFLLQPSLYNLTLYIKSNMSNLRLAYYLNNEFHFDLRQPIDELVLETKAPYLGQPKVYLEHSIPLDVDDFQLDEFYILRMRNGSLFNAGHYMIYVYIVGQVTETTLGLKYTLHRDRKTKKWTYSILLDFKQNYAKHVMLCLLNYNAASLIQLRVINDLGFHAYFIKQPVTQTVIPAPNVPSIEILKRFEEMDKFKRENTINGTSNDSLVRNETLVSLSVMYEMTLPLSSVVLYLSQNVRKTIGTPKFSATVTTERNQVGKFGNEYQYVLNLFYSYTKKYQTFGPLKLPLKYPDIFLHLHQNVTDAVDTMHTHCVLSMLFVRQSHKDVDTLNSYMARCLASIHMMTRRFPEHWDDYYILLGLREYYATFMRLTEDGKPAENDFSGIGMTHIYSFLIDDSDSSQPLLAGIYKDSEDYLNTNYLRSFCFFNMLKHLMELRKGEKFDLIVSHFLNETDQHNHTKLLFTRDSFTEAYQKVTEGKVFSTQQKIDAFFDSWTLQYGYPIVAVSRHGHILYITQRVCPISANADPEQSFIIPISIITEPYAKIEINKTHPEIWLTSREEEIQVDISGISKWFLVNNQRTGYYRVLYDDWNYKLIRLELVRGDLTKISPVSRGQILDDILFMAKIGFVRYDRALEMLEYLKNEIEELPWQLVTYELQELNYYLRYTSAYELYKHFMKVLSRRFYRVRVEDANRFSSHALQWACFGRLNPCMRFTHQAFVRIIESRETFEHISEIVCYGVKSSDDSTFLYIKLSLLDQLESMEKKLYLRALACLDNPRYLKESLNLIFRSTSAIAASLTAAEKYEIVSGMCLNTEEGAQAVLDFTFQLPKLVYFGLGDRHFREVLQSLSKSMHKRLHQRRLRLILWYLQIPDTEDLFTRMEWKRKWIQSYLSYVSKLLADYADMVVVEEYAKF